MTRAASVKAERNGGSVAPWVQAPFLLAVWLLLSGKFDLFHIGSGVVAVLFVVWLDRKLGPLNLGYNDRPVRLHPVRFLAYFPWLLWQMLLSSWQVTRVILSREMPLNPRLIRFTSPQPNTVARVVLGNSITLTPGTLTLDIDGDRYLVHALTDVSAAGLGEGEMQRKVARMFSAEDLGSVSDVQVMGRDFRGGGLN